MSSTTHPTMPRRLKFAAGVLLGLLAPLLLAEGFLRLFPPRDLHPFLGDDSPLTGHFKPDPDYGVTYRDWDAFHSDYAERLRLYEPLKDNPDSRPTWAMFGNSFIQAEGMFADFTRKRVTDRRIFNLARNERIEVRLAQIALLLDNGFSPAEIFIELMPIDLVGLGKQPLDTLRVTSRGALTFASRSSAPLVDRFCRHCRLGLAAQVRSGRCQGNPRFKPSHLQSHLDPMLLADVEHLFGNLARDVRHRNVRTTILLLPTHEQVTGNASFHFQDTLALLFRSMGLDVLDPRDSFRAAPDRAALFIPDKHYSDAGNELLLHELTAHLKQRGQSSTAKVEGSRP